MVRDLLTAFAEAACYVSGFVGFAMVLIAFS